MDRKKITELVKWFLWLGSIIGVYTEGKVSKAKVVQRYEIQMEQQSDDIQEIKQDIKEIRGYAIENKDNITRTTAILEQLVK